MKKWIVGVIIGAILLLLIVLGLFSSAFKVFAAPGQTRTLHLQWDIPLSALPNIESFNVYSTNNVAAPTGTWPIYANVVKSNNALSTNAGTVTYDLPLANAAQVLYFFVTSSNAVAESTGPPPVAAPYPPPAPLSNRIQ